MSAREHNGTSIPRPYPWRTRLVKNFADFLGLGAATAKSCSFARGRVVGCRRADESLPARGIVDKTSAIIPLIVPGAPVLGVAPASPDFYLAHPGGARLPGPLVDPLHRLPTAGFHAVTAMRLRLPTRKFDVFQIGREPRGVGRANERRPALVFATFKTAHLHLAALVPDRPPGLESNILIVFGREARPARCCSTARPRGALDRESGSKLALTAQPCRTFGRRLDILNIGTLFVLSQSPTSSAPASSLLLKQQQRAAAVPALSSFFFLRWPALFLHLSGPFFRRASPRSNPGNGRASPDLRPGRLPSAPVPSQINTIDTNSTSWAGRSRAASRAAVPRRPRNDPGGRFPAGGRIPPGQNEPNGRTDPPG